MLQKLDLSQGALGQDLLAEDIGDLLLNVSRSSTLDNIIPKCRCISSCPAGKKVVLISQVYLSNVPNDAISTLTQLFRTIVSLVDDEFLVEDLKDLATLKI